MNNVKAGFFVRTADHFAFFTYDDVDRAQDKSGKDQCSKYTYDQIEAHRGYAGAFVVSASACNSPLLPSILPLRAA